MAMRKPKQKWKVGDLFVVKTKDTKFVLGQIVGREAAVLNSVSVAFFDRRYDSPEAAADSDPPDPNDVFSVVFATRDLLDLGHWRVVGHHSPLIPEAMLPYENL